MKLPSLIALAIAVITFFVSYLIGYGTQIIYGLPIIAWCTLSAFCINWIAFVPSAYFKTEKYYDFIGMVSCICSVIIAVVLQNQHDAGSVVLAIMLSCWTLRLGLYLSRRIVQTKEDKRFDVIKTEPARFFLAWTLQGTWISVITAGALIAISNNTATHFGIITLFGLLLWLIGFTIEALADYQKEKFYQQQARPAFLSTGLWSWCRHPNYLGEILLWFGVALFTLQELEAWQHLTLFGPFFTLLLLTRVSGINLLNEAADKKYHACAEYQTYKHFTNALMPSTKFRQYLKK